jgi:hypothetical protein
MGRDGSRGEMEARLSPQLAAVKRNSLSGKEDSCLAAVIGSRSVGREFHLS